MYESIGKAISGLIGCMALIIIGLVAALITSLWIWGPFWAALSVSIVVGLLVILAVIAILSGGD